MQNETIRAVTATSSRKLPRAWRAGLVALPLLLMGAAPPPDAELVPLERPLEAVGYELIRVKHGIKVYKFHTGKDIRLAAEGIIPAPVADVREIVTDYEAQQGNVDRVTESRVIQRGADGLMVYQHLNLPVIADRDFILKVRWGHDSGTQWVVFDALRGMGPPPRDGIVRVTHHRGSWQLRPVEGGRATVVRFHTNIDFAGSVPRWMVRGGAAKELPHLFVNLCRLINPQHRSRPCP
jgi:hypothetical protein